MTREKAPETRTIDSKPLAVSESRLTVTRCKPALFSPAAMLASRWTVCRHGQLQRGTLGAVFNRYAAERPQQRKQIFPKKGLPAREANLLDSHTCEYSDDSFVLGYAYFRIRRCLIS